MRDYVVICTRKATVIEGLRTGSHKVVTPFYLYLRAHRCLYYFDIDYILTTTRSTVTHTLTLDHTHLGIE